MPGLEIQSGAPALLGDLERQFVVRIDGYGPPQFHHAVPAIGFHQRISYLIDLRDASCPGTLLANVFVEPILGNAHTWKPTDFTEKEMGYLLEGGWIMIFGRLGFPEGDELHIDVGWVEFLLEIGVSCDRDRNGSTLLDEAARHGRTDCVEAILRAGADWRRRDPMGKTSEELAIESGHAETAGMLASLRENEELACAILPPLACKRSTFL
jgi:hypothetical protein